MIINNDNKYNDSTYIKINDNKSIVESMEVTPKADVSIIKQKTIDEVNIKLTEMNVPTDMHIKNISELDTFVKLINSPLNKEKIDWLTDDVINVVTEKYDEYLDTVNNDTTIIDIDITNNDNNFDYVNNTYDIEYEKIAFLLDVNTKLKQFNVPSDITINNVSELNSFTTLVENFVPNPLNPATLTSWLNNPALKTFAKLKSDEFTDLIDPLKNVKLSDQLLINKNLDNIKDLLNLDSVPSVEQLQNIINFPDGFDMAKFTSLLKVPNLNLTSLNDLSTLLNVPDIKITLPSVGNIQIPNFASVVIPKLSSLTTGLNSDRMLGTLKEAQLKGFPESTPWEDVIKYQTAQMTKAIFDELSKMTFYIEPGEIKVLTNGSPSTHQGQNINRIKIKLK